MRAILICVIRLHGSTFSVIQIIRKEPNNKTKGAMFCFLADLNVMDFKSFQNIASKIQPL